MKDEKTLAGMEKFLSEVNILHKRWMELLTKCDIESVKDREYIETQLCAIKKAFGWLYGSEYVMLIDFKDNQFSIYHRVL